ncbi:hypothetical protein EYF80_055647 [Liparis tanakae]|uniref:Uncharacterized protein n=1 Tax=Liparis tanakae TaxID=230148 RepID=A0A4Z2EZY3_9TELE|nr:hypothetical protein EYF80_055647 [Liparis tanakae]
MLDFRDSTACVLFFSSSSFCCSFSDSCRRILNVTGRKKALEGLFIGFKADYLLMVSFKYSAAFLRFARPSSTVLRKSASSIFSAAACSLSEHNPKNTYITHQSSHGCFKVDRTAVLLYSRLRKESIRKKML